MTSQFSRWFYFKFLGWKLIGSLPDLKKYLIIVAPHTSWRDFFVGLLVRSILKEKLNFVGKKELFGPLTGWFFKGLGGAPIDRSGNKNTVDAIVSLYQHRDYFRLALAPEGTRKKVDQWRTGFYHIAKKLNIPIVPVAFDYSKRSVTIFDAYSMLEEQEKDFKNLKAYFEGVKGYHPERS